MNLAKLGVVCYPSNFNELGVWHLGQNRLLYFEAHDGDEPFVKDLVMYAKEVGTRLSLSCAVSSLLRL